MKRSEYNRQKRKDGGLVLGSYLMVGLIAFVGYLIYLILFAGYSYFVYDDELFETLKTVTAWVIFGISFIASCYVVLKIASQRFDEVDDEPKEDELYE